MTKVRSPGGGGDDPAGCRGSSEPPTLEDVVTQVMCTFSTGDPTNDHIYTVQSGKCDKGGRDVHIDTFKNNADRDHRMKVADQIGAGGSVQKGDMWVAQTA